VREYLDGIETSNPAAADDDSRKPPGRNVSRTDPAAHWTAAPGGPPQYAYSTNYLIDLEAAIIVDVKQPRRTKRKGLIRRRRWSIIWSGASRLKRRRLGDTAYGTAEMLFSMVKQIGIEPHVLVWDKTEGKDGTLSVNDFLWDRRTNQYTCPQGIALRSERRNFTESRPRHPGRHDHLSLQQGRLREMCAGALRPHLGDQLLCTNDLDHSLQVVDQHVQTHLGSHSR
jgi:hypothetical protein